MMTFEEYVATYLAGAISETVSTVPTPDSISVVLSDVTSVNYWLQQSSFTVTAVYEGKRDAGEMSALVQQALWSMRLINSVNSVAIDTERATRENNPARWTYEVEVRMLHRRKTTWP
jgi:hypothetical protein